MNSTSHSIILNHEFKFIYYKHTGVVQRKEIGEVWCKILSMSEFLDLNYNILSDYSNAKLDFDLSDTDVINQFLVEKRDILNGRKNAVVVNNPHDTVISVVFEREMLDKINFKIRTFSTLAAAEEYLSL